MSVAQKVLMIMGVVFAAIGGVISIVLAAVGIPVAFIAIPFLFVVLGIAFIAPVLVSIGKKKKIAKRGHRYAAKIYGYVDNTSYTLNGTFTFNVKVHYFDEHHMEREVILPTGIARGSGKYPIGMTIDIFEYRGKFSYDPDSVRNEILPGEDELMDDKPVSPEQIQLVAATCPNCGSSFQAAAGYSSKCPYCGSYLNV